MVDEGWEIFDGGHNPPSKDQQIAALRSQLAARDEQCVAMMYVLGELREAYPVTCTSCKGDGFLHIGCHERGQPYRVEIDKDEPCWTCGGKGVIQPRAMNAMGKSLYKLVAEEIEYWASLLPKEKEHRDELE